MTCIFLFVPVGAMRGRICFDTDGLRFMKLWNKTRHFGKWIGNK